MKRASLLLILCCGAFAVPAARAQSAPSHEVAITVCILNSGGDLQEIAATYDPATRDTTVVVDGQRRPFSAYHRSTTVYAESHDWYINNGAVKAFGKRYVKYGLPRVIGVSEVVRRDEYKGVPVFAEAGLTGTPEVIYVPVRMGCEFQPYMADL